MLPSSEKAITRPLCALFATAFVAVSEVQSELENPLASSCTLHLDRSSFVKLTSTIENCFIGASSLRRFRIVMPKTPTVLLLWISW